MKKILFLALMAVVFGVFSFPGDIYARDTRSTLSGNYIWFKAGLIF